MQATPAPTEAPGSPQPSQVTASQQPFPEQPYNTDTLPFHILTAFFEKLQGERKQEKRRKLLNHWFNVCISSKWCSLHSSCAIEMERRQWTGLVSCTETDSSARKIWFMKAIYQLTSGLARPGTQCVWSEREGTRQVVHQGDTPEQERPRRYAALVLEEAD